MWPKDRRLVWEIDMGTMYCSVSIHLYSASCSAHQSGALPVRETQRQDGTSTCRWRDVWDVTLKRVDWLISVRAMKATNRSVQRSTLSCREAKNDSSTSALKERARNWIARQKGYWYHVACYYNSTIRWVRSSAFVGAYLEPSENQPEVETMLSSRIRDRSYIFVAPRTRLE